MILAVRRAEHLRFNCFCERASTFEPGRRHAIEDSFVISDPATLHECVQSFNAFLLYSAIVLVEVVAVV
jgi:hypothetical protein